MEINPILEANVRPNPNIWYVLSPDGEGPCIRVGHTSTFLPSDRHRVMIIGGANPDGTFADLYVLDLDKFQWSCPDWKGITSRYEHSAFVPECNTRKVYVFGGAQQATNMNDVQALDLEKGEWTTIQTSGTPPCPRTCHSMPFVGSKLYVFGGGLSGPDPVPDVTMHVFDAVNNSWCQPAVTGTPPSARHGHVSVALGSAIYIHGGMAGTELYDDLFKYNTESHTWTKLEPTGDFPSQRTAHAAACIGKKIFVFGGMSSIGTAFDDLYCLDTDTLMWTRLECDGPSPCPRLDHTLCTIKLPAPKGDSDETETKTNTDDLMMLLLFGGMDTQGEIFNDALVLLMETSK